MTHRERIWGCNTISRPGADGSSSLPGSAAGRAPESADPKGNRAQRRAAKRLGMAPATSTEEED